MRRWIGLTELLADAVEHGSRAVEDIHQHVASTPFRVLAALPPVAAPARRAMALQELAIAGAYQTVRLAGQAVGAAVTAVLEAAESRRPEPRDAVPSPERRGVVGDRPIPGGDVEPDAN